MFADIFGHVGWLRLLMVLFFGSVPFYFVMLTKDLRTKLQAEIGYRPRLNSTVLWEAVKQKERRNQNKMCVLSGLVDADGVYVDVAFGFSRRLFERCQLAGKSVTFKVEKLSRLKECK